MINAVRWVSTFMVLATVAGCQMLDFKSRNMERELVDTRVKIIQSKLDEGQFMSAQFELEPLLRKFPDELPLITLSGFIDMALGNNKRAISSLKRVYEEEKDAGSALNLSSAYIAARLYPAALKMVEQGMEHHKDENYNHIGRLWHNRGYIYERMGRRDLALKNYRQALYHAPGYIPTLKQIAALYEKMGQAQAALMYYRRYAYACQACFFPMSKLVYHLKASGDKEVARRVVENYLKNSYISVENKQKARQLLSHSLDVRGDKVRGSHKTRDDKK